MQSKTRPSRGGEIYTSWTFIMTLAIDRTQTAQQTETVTLFFVREGDHIIFDGKEWEVAGIHKCSWSWVGQPVIWGQKYTIDLFPIDFEFTAQQPKSKDKAEWDAYWRQWQADQDRHRSLRRRFESHGTFQVKRVVNPTPTNIEIRNTPQEEDLTSAFLRARV